MFLELGNKDLDISYTAVAGVDLSVISNVVAHVDVGALVAR